MKIKKTAIIILVSILIINFSVNQTFATIKIDELVTLMIHDQVMLGEKVEMDITLTEDYDDAVYGILVISPGGIDKLQEKVDIEALLNKYEWNILGWIEFKNDFKLYCETEGIDISYKLGSLDKVSPTDTLIYPEEFENLLGESSILIPDKYDVIVIAFNESNYQYTFDAIGSGFFVITEVPLGSFMALLSMFTAAIIKKQSLIKTRNI